MAKTKRQLDFDKSFPDRYLACANALDELEHWMMVVGLSGSRAMSDLRREFLAHGAETFRDINREAAE